MNTRHNRNIKSVFTHIKWVSGVIAALVIIGISKSLWALLSGEWSVQHNTPPASAVCTVTSPHTFTQTLLPHHYTKGHGSLPHQYTSGLTPLTPPVWEAGAKPDSLLRWTTAWWLPEHHNSTPHGPFLSLQCTNRIQTSISDPKVTKYVRQICGKNLYQIYKRNLDDFLCNGKLTAVILISRLTR